MSTAARRAKRAALREASRVTDRSLNYLGMDVVRVARRVTRLEVLLAVLTAILVAHMLLKAVL